MFMKKSIFILAVSLTVPALFSACTQEDILYDVDFNVTLAPENTYYAGDPVTFNFEGEVDNLLFFSGESGHEYRYKDRYSITMDLIKSATLHLEIQPRYGTGTLGVWYSSSFTGLAGNDGEADRATMAQLEEGGMSGWTPLTIWDDENKETSTVTRIVEFDITQAIENFALAFLWDHEGVDPATGTQRHYWVNGSISIEAEGFGTINTDLSSLAMTSVMMNEEEEDPYRKNDGNGSIRFDTEQDINFQGCGANEKSYALKGWVVTTPQMLNAVSNDTGTVIKNMQNYMETFSYTFAEPGTYTVTFVGRNVNYVGSSEQVKEVTVTILDRPLDGGNGAGETDQETPAE